MSLINKVLRDLDRRNAGAGERTPSPSIRAIDAKPGGREWFWRILAGLVLVALGWVGWVVYQVQPRPIATELAFAAAEIAAAKPSPPLLKVEPAQAAKPSAAPPVVVAAVPVEAAKPAAKVEPEPKPAATPPRPPAVEALRFSYSIDTPIGAPQPKPSAKRPEAKVEKKDALAAAAAGAPAAGKGKVERHDREFSNVDRAEVDFRRGVDLLKRGRTMESEGLFALALKSDPAHRGARQALVALKLERNQLDEAARLLREGLATDPAQPDFASALARIYTQRGQFPAALDALDVVPGAATANLEYQVMRGSVLQRLGRHADATAAYRAALSIQPAVPQAWMGLGISLEALQQKSAAADAFRNALAAGPVSSELRLFAEQRIQALR